jgi:hypothetical protein
MTIPPTLITGYILSGSRPVPDFEFSVGGRVLPSSDGRLFVEEDQSPSSLVTMATLKYVPTAEDNGKYLACTATNRYFPEVREEDGFIVNVRCEWGLGCCQGRQMKE